MSTKQCRTWSEGVFCDVCSGSTLFVCIKVLWPSQPNGVMSSTVSLPNHTLTRQASSSKQLTSIVHILSPETDNCPSWINGRERMTVENYIMIKSPRKNVAELQVLEQTGLSKQWRSRSDATFCGIWSGSTLFATHSTIIKHINL